jgi:glycosyltransferase involved in cell wall biosynthesis
MSSTLHEHHPDAELTVLLLDADPDEVADFAGAQLIAAADAVGEQFGLLAAANPAGALSMAVIPHLIRRVLASGDGSVLYVGAGQRVLGLLNALVSLTRDHDVVLVARASVAARSLIAQAELGEGAFSWQLLGLRSGTSTSALLDAWPRYFTTEDDEGAGAVRTWIDGIPALVPNVGILRDARYRPDRWSSSVQAPGDFCEMNDELRPDVNSARIIDFGELDAREPQSWFDRPDRVAISSAPELAQLAELHAEQLREAGWSAEGTRQPPYAQLQDGLRLTEAIRALLVNAILVGEVTSSPFVASGRAELYHYLNEPGARGRASGLTRLHMAIWDRRSDLQEAYPHLDGPDGPGFAGWLCAYADEQEGLVPELLPPVPELSYRDADSHAHEDAPRAGVNVVGFFTSELGVGEVARLLIAGLDARRIPALPIQGNLAPPSRQGASFSYADIDDAAYPINVVCVNGDGIPVFAREAGRAFFEDRYTIAVWWWEVGGPPSSWTGAYEFVDEVWVASQYVYDAIAPSSPVPVVKITLPLLLPERVGRTRAQLGLPEGFVFLYAHDYHSVFARKHPIGLIEAFCKAFAPGSGAKLVLKSINAPTRAHEHERAMHAASRHPDITLIDGYVSAAEKDAMIEQADCYVSLHRSEGFGLTLAEALLMGKPVIATRFGGNMEYMSDENSYLVDYKPTLVGEGVYPYPPDGVWAEPDLDRAAALMRRVFSEREEAQSKGRLARAEMISRHSPDVAGAVMERRLTLIAERMYEEGARSLNLEHLPPLSDELRGVAAKPPTINWGRGIASRLKRRALRPLESWILAYVAHETNVDAERRRTISALDDRMRDVARNLKDQQNARHAETMAELRRIKSHLGELAAPSRPDGRDHPVPETASLATEKTVEIPEPFSNS